MDDEERLGEEMKQKRICRFCLTQEEPLTDIFLREGASGSGKTKTTPLTLQIMACVAIEVYKDDGMPSTICDNCRTLMDHSYQFKQICKKADTLLKTYPLTGVWPEKLQVPVNLFKAMRVVQAPAKTPAQSVPPTIKAPVSVQRKVAPAAPVAPKPAPPSPVVKKSVTIIPASAMPNIVENVQSVEIMEQEEEQPEMEEDVKPTIVKLSIEDLRNIKQGRPINRPQMVRQFAGKKKSEIKVLKSEVIVPADEPKEKIPKKPVILNSLKSPRITEEHYVHTAEGTLEIISTDAPDSSDPMKCAPPVETDVYPCTECERSFPLRQLLDIHMQNHNRERNHPCEVCDKRFFSKYDLAKHTLTHTGERPYVCVICKSAFSRSTLLTRHQKVHKDQPKFLCMYCERTFLSSEELQKHTETHQKNRPFQCTKCPKSFAYKQGLERHEVTHDTNLPFPCEHCELSFSTAGKLARHLTAHAGNRPYPCRWCNRSFLLSHHLTRHVRAHLGGQGVYKCNACSSVFDSQDELIDHSAEHVTKSKTCPLCGEHFETLESVTAHIKLHSEGVQFACDYCDLLFTTEERLDAHCQNEHLSVLATERTDDGSEQQPQQQSTGQLTIEEITIGTDGSQMITTFVDGEEKETKFLKRGSPIKSEVMEEDIQLEYAEEEEYEEEPEEPEPEPEPVRRRPAPVKEEKFSPGVSKLEVSKSPQAAASSAKSTQQKLDMFFKKSQTKTVATEPPRPALKSVTEVLKNLPKGVVIKKPTTSTAAPTETSKPQKPSPAKPAVAKPSQSVAAPPAPKRSPAAAAPVPPKGRTSSPEKLVRISPRTTNKRPREESQSPSPTKKLAVESKLKPPAVVPAEPRKKISAEPATPAPKTRPKPLCTSTPFPTAAPAQKTSGKTFEMKIGDKMVKVQKVIMTKAEVAAMARDGKIEMQGDTMILKQPKEAKKYGK